MVTLIPMTENDYQAYLEQLIGEYAQDHVRGGRWGEQEALQRATQEIQQILPQGLHSPDNYLYMIVEEQSNQRVGILWFALNTRASKQQAFVYDIAIYEQFRRHGYATQAFRLLEEQARELGATSIGLHVFGHNVAARELYEKLGYIATNIQMMKKLEVEE